MTEDLQRKCLSEGNAWTFMKLSAVLILVGLGMDGYLMLTHSPDTLGEHLRLLFLAFWSGIIGMVSFGLTSAWFMWRAITRCRSPRGQHGTSTRS